MSLDDGFIEAGAKPHKAVAIPEAPNTQETDDGMEEVPAPSSNPQYVKVTNQLQGFHADLLRLETEGKLANTSDLPGMASEYQRKMRLNVNMLYAFMNQYIDVLSDLQKEHAELWDRLYKQRLNQPKGTPSAAKTHADALSKREAVTIDIVKNRINQIKNDYERYNGICISLQSTMKAENTERIMG